MSEDQERFEDYLELEHYIEELQAGHVAHPPAELTPGQARIYRMAALFRSAAPDAAEPGPEFAAELRTRLEEELRPSAVSGGKPSPVEKRSRLLQKRSSIVSRRALLTGGAAVAASVVIGAGIEHVAEQARGAGHAGGSPPVGAARPTQPAPAALISEGVPTTWYPAATLAELSKGAVRFVTETIVGYVILGDNDAPDPADRGKVIAMSAACTHMGCIVQWQSSDQKFHCPCHGRQFTEYGKIDFSGPGYYVYPLPRLKTKIENGKVLVEVPLPR